MNVDAIMSCQVISVSMDDTLRQVRDLLEVHRFHHVVVVDGRRVVGIISDRDVLANLSPFVGKASERALDAASLNRKVHQIMSRDLIAATPGTRIADAAALLLKHGISCLPVLDGQGACVGIVTWRDVLRWTYRIDAGKPAKGAEEKKLAA